MASKRHRQLRSTRPPHDKMAIAHRHRVEAQKRAELATAIPYPFICVDDGSTFYAIDPSPSCPSCGQDLVRRMQ